MEQFELSDFDFDIYGMSFDELATKLDSFENLYKNSNMGARALHINYLYSLANINDKDAYKLDNGKYRNHECFYNWVKTQARDMSCQVFFELFKKHYRKKTWEVLGEKSKEASLKKDIDHITEMIYGKGDKNWYKKYYYVILKEMASFLFEKSSDIELIGYINSAIEVSVLRYHGSLSGLGDWQKGINSQLFSSGYLKDTLNLTIDMNLDQGETHQADKGGLWKVIVLLRFFKKKGARYLRTFLPGYFNSIKSELTEGASDGFMEIAEAMVDDTFELFDPIDLYKAGFIMALDKYAEFLKVESTMIGNKPDSRIPYSCNKEEVEGYFSQFLKINDGEAKYKGMKILSEDGLHQFLHANFVGFDPPKEIKKLKPNCNQTTLRRFIYDFYNNDAFNGYKNASQYHRLLKENFNQFDNMEMSSVKKNFSNLCVYKFWK